MQERDISQTTATLQGYTIILFYNYVPVADPKALREEQVELCTKLGLKGRVIVAEEGINATLEGTDDNITQYLQAFLAKPEFAHTHIKKSRGTGDAFPKLSVKVRPEIVSLHLQKDISPREKTGKRLSAQELKEWFTTKKVGQDFYIVDMRNDYEFRVGRFVGSVQPALKNFRDLNQGVKDIEDLKDKTVLTVCTGGVRCEKASGYLLDQGFSDVYQLDGGMVTYMEQFPGQGFEGSLYVFDRRVTMHFDSPEQHVVVGRCDICEQPCERYVNCKNPRCNAHFLCCSGCGGEERPACPACARQGVTTQ